MGYDDVIVQCLSLEEALSYSEWFKEKAAQYNIEVDSTLFIGENSWFVSLRTVC